MGGDYYASAIIGCEIPDEKLIILKNKDIEEKMKFLGVCFKRATDGEGGVIGLNKFSTSRVDINYDDCCLKAEANDFTSAREQTMYALDQLGMWNPKTFGLWVVGYCCD